MQSYTRTLQTDFTVNEIDISSFLRELNEAALPSVVGIRQSGNDIITTFAETLTVSQVNTFDDLCLNYEYSIFDDSFALLKDVKAVGTNGGSSVAGVWTRRELNTLDGNQTFCTLNDNEFRLIGRGLFQVRAQAPASHVRNHKIRLYDVGLERVVATGTSAYTENKTVTYSTIDTVIVKGNAPMSLELQHITDSTVTNTGFGIASAFDTDETYSIISIVRL